jgi:hypothetical protein
VETLNKKRGVIIGAILCVIVLILSTTGSVLAAYGQNRNSDGWGNEITITASYNPYGGTVTVESTAYWVGGSIFGVNIGVPVFYGGTMTIYVIGYWNKNIVFATGLTYTKGWQFSKSWNFNLPGGLTSIVVQAYATFWSIPFGNSAVLCYLYA